MSRVGDRFWLWGHEARSHNQNWNIPMPSGITPVEAAFYMGIQNVIMVRYGTASWPPDPQYIVPFRRLRQVVWSVVGAGGRHQSDQTTRVLELPKHLPNTTGVIMDDFFRSAGDGEDVAVLSLAELRSLTGRLSNSGRKLDLWAVLYDHQLDLPVREHLEMCDKLTFWTWRADNLRNLERNFGRFERLVPEGRRRVLGCYMWDYGQKRPMPLELMEQQCELGLRWLKERRIEGMIFLASCICDLDLDAVEWTRRWLEQVGNHVL